MHYIFLSQLPNLFWNFVNTWCQIICYSSSFTFLKRKNLLTFKDFINRLFIFCVIFIGSTYNRIISLFLVFEHHKYCIMNILFLILCLQCSQSYPWLHGNKLLLKEFDIGTRCSHSPFNNRFVNVKSILSS